MKNQTVVHNERQEAMNWLLESFPAAFFSQKKQIKPLKLGIYEDIMDFYERITYPPIRKKSLREALNHYSSSKHYLSCQVAGAWRIDLFGQAFELVTEEQAAYAKAQIQGRLTRKAQNDTSSNNSHLNPEPETPSL